MRVKVISSALSLDNITQTDSELPSARAEIGRTSTVASAEERVIKGSVEDMAFSNSIKSTRQAILYIYVAYSYSYFNIYYHCLE